MYPSPLTLAYAQDPRYTLHSVRKTATETPFVIHSKNAPSRFWFSSTAPGTALVPRTLLASQHQELLKKG